MKPSFYAPHPALANYISHIMVVEIRSDIMSNNFSPFPPTPQHAIHFYPRDAVKTYTTENDVAISPDSIIVGPQVTKVNIAMGMHHIIVSVAFQPGGLFRLLGIPMYEFYDQAYDATLVLGKDMREVNERLREAVTHIEMKNIVQQYFMRKIRISALLPWEHAMKAQLNGPLSIETAASLSCLSLRQFERRSKEVMGYSPKVFSRLIRFSKAYRLKENSPSTNWTAIAHACGYFDQMHLIRDFKEFAGVTPGLITRQLQQAPHRLQGNLKI
jgi:AraC-like DNA-binding protein